MQGRVAASQIRALKARLLRPTRMEAVLEWILERLPRNYLWASLKPLRNIEVIDEIKGDYKATNNDPWFELSLAGRASPHDEWIYIEGVLVRPNGSRVATLRVEVDGSPEAGYSWPVTTNLRGSIREVIYLPAGVTRICWQPAAATGYFSQNVMVHAISHLESVCRRLYRVKLVSRHIPGKARGLPWLAGILWRNTSQLTEAYRRSADIRMSLTLGNDYDAFLAREPKAEHAALTIGRHTGLLQLRPLLSLAICLDNPDVRLLPLAIESVVGQIYENWELCIVGDVGASREVANILNSYAKNPRVRLISDLKVSTPNEVFGRSLQEMQGTYVAWLGQHDVIDKGALANIVFELVSRPDVDLIYTDEDKIDYKGTRQKPSFKPDWNPDLLLSSNYVGRLAFFKLDRLRQLGFLDQSLDASPEFQLLLRFTSDRSRISHIHKVLYSRRIEESCSQMNDADQELRTLQAHLVKTEAIAVNGMKSGVYRVIYPLPETIPLVSIIVPTRDRLDILRTCVESVRTKTDYPNWEMLIVDNQSVLPETMSYFSEIVADSRIKIVNFDAPFNYSAINNYAVDVCQGEIVALLNNDTEVISSDWLSEMVRHAIRPGIGVVGAKLLYSNGSVQHAGVVLGIGGVAGHVHRYLDQDEPGYCNRAIATQNLSAVTGACLVVRKAIFREVQGLNHLDLVVALNDVDFCLKVLSAGYRNVFTPHALLYHHESISRGKDDTPEKNAIFLKERRYMRETWKDLLDHDPAYNSNLTLDHENYSLNTTDRSRNSLPAGTFR